MCRQELIEKIKTKSSLITMENYVSEIMKEKYKNKLLDEEIYSLFEKVIDLAKDLFEEDKSSQAIDITSIFAVLQSLCNKLQIDLFSVILESKQENVATNFA